MRIKLKIEVVKICSDEVECGSLSAGSTSLACGIGAESEPWLFQNAIIAPGQLSPTNPPSSPAYYRQGARKELCVLALSHDIPCRLIRILLSEMTTLLWYD